MSHEKSSSYWMTHHTLPKFPPLTGNLKVQVGIIGGGITGLTTAYELTRRGLSVVVLDKTVGCGDSCRTTAHLTSALDERFSVLERHFGKKNTCLASESHAAAIDFIEAVCNEKKIECGFDRVDAYLFNPPGEEPNNLVEELNAAKRLGLEGVTMVDESPISSFNTGPCLKFLRQGQLLPLPYLDGLTRCIIEQGGKIFTAHVQQIEEKEESCCLITDDGFVIEVDSVVVATHSPISSAFFPHLKQASYRSYVIAGVLPKGYVPKALYYDTPDPYHYIRIVEEADNDILIVGGEDHRVGMREHMVELYEILERWTKTRFPAFGPVTHRWSGQIVEPIDSLAFIGRSTPGSRIYLATGHSGNGFTHGTIAGILLSDLITNKTNPWEQLYDPCRKTLGSLGEFLEENAETIGQYRDWITPGDVNSVDEIPVKSGAILREGASKIAVYKDNEGRTHRLSAVCPHLKGLVRWNEAEKSWDCPCHGSRFSAIGEVLNGPANKPLTPLE